MPAFAGHDTKMEWTVRVTALGRRTSGAVGVRLAAQHGQTMIERRSEQRLDFRDEIGGGVEALPGVVVRLTIPDLKNRIAIGTVELLEDAIAQNARTVGFACRCAVVDEFVLPARYVTFLQQLHIGDDVQRS